MLLKVPISSNHPTCCKVTACVPMVTISVFTPLPQNKLSVMKSAAPVDDHAEQERCESAGALRCAALAEISLDRGPPCRLLKWIPKQHLKANEVDAMLLSCKSVVNILTRLHRRRTRTVQSYSPGCANVHPHLVHPSGHLHRTGAARY